MVRKNSLLAYCLGLSSAVVRKTSLLTSLLFGPIVLACAGGLKSCGKKDQPTSILFGPVKCCSKKDQPANILFGPIVLAVVLGMTSLLRILFGPTDWNVGKTMTVYSPYKYIMSLLFIFTATLQYQIFHIILTFS